MSILSSSADAVQNAAAFLLDVIEGIEDEEGENK